MNRPHSHRNLLWSGHWPVVFHKQTGTLLYSLFVSWSFYWQSNGRVDGFTMCTLSDAYCDLSFSIVVFLLKSSTESLLYISLDVTKLNAFNILVLPALLCPIMTLIPSWKSTVVLSKFLNPLIVMFEIYIE